MCKCKAAIRHLNVKGKKYRTESLITTFTLLKACEVYQRNRRVYYIKEALCTYRKPSG